MTVDDAEPEMVQGFTGDLDRLREIILKQRSQAAARRSTMRSIRPANN